MIDLPGKDKKYKYF